MVKNRGPGPAAYMLPTAVGYDKHTVIKNRRPQYSFGLRSNVKEEHLGPGPAAYKPDKLNRYGPANLPAYSLRPRTGLKDPNLGPGPAGYNIGGKSEVQKQRAPAYSLAARTFKDQRDKVPGPNTYLYGVGFVKPGAPAFSMGKRTTLPYDKNQSPGPAAYGRSDLHVINKRSPAYTLAKRTNVIDKRVSPGPMAYDLKNFRPGDTGPVYSFGIRHGPDAPPMIVECDN